MSQPEYWQTEEGRTMNQQETTDLEVIIAVDELYGALFGTPRVLALGRNLSAESTRFGAAKGQVSYADGKRERGEPLELYWEQDQGDGVTSHIHWQTVKVTP